MIDVNIFLFWTNISIFVLCGGLFAIMPRLTRKSYLFGVKIPSEEADCPEALELRRRYIRTCLLGCSLLLIICVVQYFARRDLTLLATMYLPLMIVPIQMAAFIPSWRGALRLKEEKGWQVSHLLYAETGSSHTRGTLSALPWMWYILSAMVLAASFAVVIIRYPSLPDVIPGHLDANMRPDRWVDKTWLNTLMLPLINCATLALMAPVGIFIEKAKLQIDAADPRLSFAQHRVYRRRMGHAMGFMTLVITVYVAVIGLPILYPDSPVWGAGFFWGSMALVLIPTAVVVAVSVRTGQGGCRVIIDMDVSMNETDGPPSLGRKLGTGGQGDDQHWIFGMFYYNPHDPTFIVEDRFGTNLGFNYARLPVQIVAAAVIISLIALYVWMTIVVL